MKIIQVKCASCGAGLDAQDDQASIKCEYCGTVSRIQKRTGLFTKEELKDLVDPDVLVSVERRSAGARSIVWTSALLPLLIGGGVLVYMLVLRHTPGGGSIGGSSRMQWEGVGGVLLEDLNNDGVVDLVGRTRYLGGQGRVHLAAFDGKSGDQLWETEPLGTYSETYQGRASLAGQAVLFGGTQGELHAYSLKDGKRLWRIPLGEKTQRLCEDQEGLVTVKTIDGRRHRIRLADGTRAQGEAPACRPLPHDRREGDFRHSKVKRGPRAKGIRIRETRKLLPDGPLVSSGTKHPGTRVPMVAVFGSDRKLIWKSEVPGADRLRVKESAPTLVAFDRQRLFALYKPKDINKPQRMSAFDMTDGRRLWELTLQTAMPQTTLQVTPELVLVSSWGRLDTFGPQDGKPRFTVGWSMK